jgi:hypothetical protein
MYLAKEHKFVCGGHTPIPARGLKLFCFKIFRKSSIQHFALMQKNTAPNFPYQKKNLRLAISFLLFSCNSVWAQTTVIEKNKFFTDDRLVEMAIVSDFNTLIKGKHKKDYQERYQPATITCTFPDSTTLKDEIEIRPRGNYRREECTMPPLMVSFKKAEGEISKLGAMKLVWPCGLGGYGEQLVLKEYLAYKIFNLVTEKSFRVRLVKIGYRDTKDKIKPRTLYGFFIEDIDEMARRNNCKEIDYGRFNTEATNREQATFVTLFQYMIGNCDWAIPIYRNIKLIQSSTDSLARPYAIPYDFDYSGLVSAPYAIPPLDLPITSVQQRYYLGFPRTMGELQYALQIFRTNKNSMDSLIINLQPLENPHKKQMSRYLGEFFNSTAKESNIEFLFIVNARKE